MDAVRPPLREGVPDVRPGVRLRAVGLRRTGRSTPAGAGAPIKAAGAAPIMVVGTTRDPATPLVWAEALADQLDSGVLVKRDGDGHTGYHAGNACVDTPSSPTSCRAPSPKAEVDC